MGVGGCYEFSNHSFVVITGCLGLRCLVNVSCLVVGVLGLLFGLGDGLLFYVI